VKAIRYRAILWLLFLALLFPCPLAAGTTEVLVLGKDTIIRERPRASAKPVKTANPGETYEILGRRSGNPLYVFDERGDLWVRIRVGEEGVGFVRTDLAAVAREEYRSPRGNPLLIVNLRPTAEGAVSRELWVVQEDWRRTRWLGSIEGHPVWSSRGDWFICQMDSERPIKDQTMDRTIERIERFSPDGRTRTVLAAGSYPVPNEARGEVYFYRDVDERGDPVPPGLFAVNVNGTNLRPVFLLPERYRFWKEEGDYFVQAPAPVLNASAGRIALYAYEQNGVRARITVGLDGQFLEMRRD
jgi:hypothetical protein